MDNTLTPVREQANNNLTNTSWQFQRFFFKVSVISNSEKVPLDYDSPLKWLSPGKDMLNNSAEDTV